MRQRVNMIATATIVSSLSYKGRYQDTLGAGEKVNLIGSYDDVSSVAQYRWLIGF